MSSRIDSIYYFDFTHNIAFYDSIRDFASLEMTYIGMAISTPKVRVNATPTEYIICDEGSELIRELAVSQLPTLIEISKDLADNSPRYFQICYADGAKKYFKYNNTFHQSFELAKQYEPKSENCFDQYDNPYAYQETSSSFSPYAIQQPSAEYTVNAQRTTPQTQTRASTNQENTGDPFVLWKLAIIIVLFLGLVGLMFSELVKDSNPGLTPVEEPKSGTILSGMSYFDAHVLTITASNNESCVVKLKSKSGENCLSFYVRAGDTVTVNVPDKYLFVYFASGTTWYGEDHLFGNGTNYYMDDEMIDFVSHSCEYVLRPVNDGNFEETPIDSDEF